MKFPSYYAQLPPEETGANIPQPIPGNDIARVAVDTWLNLHNGPLSLVLGTDSITLKSRRRSPVGRPAGRGPRPGSWEAGRHRSNLLARKRFEDALRLAIRDHSEVVTRDNGDVTFAAPVSRVFEAFLALRRHAGLSMVTKAIEVDWFRGRSAAKDAAAVEEMMSDGILYVRPSWAPYNAKKKTH